MFSKKKIQIAVFSFLAACFTSSMAHADTWMVVSKLVTANEAALVILKTDDIRNLGANKKGITALWLMPRRYSEISIAWSEVTCNPMALNMKSRAPLTIIIDSFGAMQAYPDARETFPDNFVPVSGSTIGAGLVNYACTGRNLLRDADAVSFRNMSDALKYADAFMKANRPR